MTERVLDLENWKLEADAVINDIMDHVKEAFISQNIYSNNQRIYINIETLEGDKFCVELSCNGFRICGRVVIRLGTMDSLHVSGQQISSKTSSRSASPCRPRSEHPPHHVHHTKTLSHGSADSNKSQDGLVSRPISNRHRSPTASTSTRPEMEESGNLSHTLDEIGPAEGDTSEVYYPHSFVSNGSTEHVKEDETDGSRPNPVIEQLESKIVRTKDLIRTEQKLRDDNVNEYLKLATNADKHQLQRIRILKIGYKCRQTSIAKDKSKTQGVQGHKPTREVLRDMGQGLKNVGGNIRDGISGFSGSVMSKPREFAHLIKNKFGSADNISQLSRPGTTGSEGSGTNGGAGSEQGEKTHHGSATLPANLHSATSHNSMSQNVPQKFPSDEGSECSSVMTSESIERYGRGQEDVSQDSKLKALYNELQTKQQECARLRDLEDNYKTLQQEVTFLHTSLQDERFKSDRLEEQINDLTELHQNEVENLKQLMNELEERVQYQSEERLRDIHEMLEHCQTKIQKMEHQALQQQQYVTIEGIDNSNARALVVKLINVLLTVLQVILLLVATCAGIIMPFLRTRVRILTTTFIVLAAVFILRQWPEVQDIGSHVMKRLKDTLDPVK
ncbi:GSKIP domain [Popillia japonica]|uniref:GSKIP domain n=1 Tax=Popillia japonica TaxID=7064 RepID=A0AAW1MJY7_POPJA